MTTLLWDLFWIAMRLIELLAWGLMAAPFIIIAVYKLGPKLADWLIARAKRTPYFHLEGYMLRWWLLPYAKWRPAVRVHEIIGSDDDRAYHDHPWPYLSIILKGGYFELRPRFESGIYVGDKRTWYGAGSVIWRPAASWHRLEIPEGGSATTLFMTGQYKRRWGFLVEPAHKLYHKDYVDKFGAPEWRT